MQELQLLMKNKKGYDLLVYWRFKNKQCLSINCAFLLLPGKF